MALTAASLVLMPILGRANHSLAERLDSAATAGEGTQNYLCGAQAAAVLVGLAVVVVLAELLVVRPGDRPGRRRRGDLAGRQVVARRGLRLLNPREVVIPRRSRPVSRLPHVLGIIGMRGELPKSSSASVASPVAAPALTLVAVPENPSGPAPCVEGYTVGSSSRSRYSWPRPSRSTRGAPAPTARRLLRGRRRGWVLGALSRLRACLALAAWLAALRAVADRMPTMYR